jgi:hypothetical protein
MMGGGGACTAKAPNTYVGAQFIAPDLEPNTCRALAWLTIPEANRCAKILKENIPLI